ncbi:MAG: aspartate kinase [Anaerolineae bacterium]|jgi:aspartate kinase|nr:aspartate kinase [Anaerolineae bacterium]
MATITMKFGGTSVGSVEAITNVVAITKREVAAGHQVALVVSAMSRITDGLLNIIQMAENRDKWGYLSEVQKMRERHEEAINALMAPGKNRDNTALAINKLLDEAVEVCHAINILSEASPRIRDAIVSYGERMSARLVAAALSENGLNSRAYDATQFIVTDDRFGSAAPMWAETERRIRDHLLPQIQEGVVPVLTGFIGATKDGAVTTLGRGGSDFSGAIFAAYTRSDELVIWTDVDGVMTTDPRIDRRAKVIDRVSYTEVGELAYYGAKVLHPKTVQPVLDLEVPIRVRNTFNYDHPGTLITAQSEAASTVIKAVTAVRNVSLLTVSGRGMIGVPGVAGRVFTAAARAKANVLMFSQSSSEQAMCLIVSDDMAQAAKEGIEDELKEEIARRNVEGVALQPNIAIVTVVGSGMRGTPGVAGRVFSAMGAKAINVLMIAQGSSECSISFAVDASELKDAVYTLHELAL